MSILMTVHARGLAQEIVHVRKVRCFLLGFGGDCFLCKEGFRLFCEVCWDVQILLCFRRRFLCDSEFLRLHGATSAKYGQYGSVGPAPGFWPVVEPALATQHHGDSFSHRTVVLSSKLGRCFNQIGKLFCAVWHFFQFFWIV